MVPGFRPTLLPSFCVTYLEFLISNFILFLSNDITELLHTLILWNIPVGKVYKLIPYYVYCIIDYCIIDYVMNVLQYYCSKAELDQGKSA